MKPMLPDYRNNMSSDLVSLRIHSLAGLGTLAVLFVCLGGWMATTNLASAVVANGVVNVAGGNKQIQHAEGGIVEAILARDGDFVHAGDILIRLDGVMVQSELSIITSQLQDGLARQARLYAESVQSDRIILPALAVDLPVDPQLSALLGDQARLYQSRKASLEGRDSQLQQQISQTRSQIAGMQVQKDAVHLQADLLAADEMRLQDLLGRGLMESSRVNDVKRSRAEMDGELGRLSAAIASAGAALSALETSRVQLADDFQSEVLQELGAVTQQTQELLPRWAAAQDRLRRLDIRTPVDGVVYQSAVQTLGRVISAGETIMQVVPGGDQLTLEVRLSPLDIDKVHVGQEASARFSGLDPRTTPELAATISSIAPNLTRDAGTGAQFFEVQVAVNAAQSTRLAEGISLVPGMPAEVYLRTGDRTVLSYLFAPFAEQISRALRD